MKLNEIVTKSDIKYEMKNKNNGRAQNMILLCLFTYTVMFWRFEDGKSESYTIYPDKTIIPLSYERRCHHIEKIR